MKNAFYIVLIFFVGLISCQKEKKATPNSIPISEKASSTVSIDTINWYTELCTMNSQFETSKYSKKQLIETHKLWFSTSGYISFDGYPIFELTDNIEPLHILEQRYKERKQEISSLETVDLPYWKNIKRLKLLELKYFYEHKKNAVIAYSNPAVLEQTNYDPKAKIYVDALVSGDSLKMITAWKKLVEEQKSKNGSPNSLEKKFQYRLHSSQCLAYAKMELFSFGWNNYSINPSRECEVLSRTDILFNEYKKLFISTKEDCDEP